MNISFAFGKNPSSPVQFASRECVDSFPIHDKKHFRIVAGMSRFLFAWTFAKGGVILPWFFRQLRR